MARLAHAAIQIEVDGERGKKSAREDIELLLREYHVVSRPRGGYKLQEPYADDDDLDKTMHDMPSEIHSAADLRHCHVESDARQEGTERYW